MSNFVTTMYNGEKAKLRAFPFFITKHRVQTTSGASPHKFLWGSLCKSWNFYSGQYSDLSEGSKNRVAESWYLDNITIHLLRLYSFKQNLKYIYAFFMVNALTICSIMKS